MPRGRKTVLSITLTPDERETLLTWQRSTTIPVGRARRGQMLLLLGDGMPVVQIADTVGVTHRVVYTWAQRFLQDGIAGLADKPGRGRRPVLTTPVKVGQASRRRRVRTHSRRSSNHLASRVAMPRGRKTTLTIHLTPDERQTLTRWQRSTTIRAGYANRGRILLLLADGLSVVQVATRVGITRRFVYKWAKRFVQDGLEGMEDKRRRGTGQRPRQRDRT